MADKIYDVGRFRHSIDNWQLSMLLGIIFFIVGIVVFFEPGGTYLALSVLFGIVVILSGAFELYLGTKAPTGSGKGWYIAGGVVEILLGILLLCTPSMLFTILPFVLGFWLLFRGFMAVGVASEMMGVGIKGAGWTMTLGILVIISAFLVLFNPIIGVGVVVFWVGLSLLLAGVEKESYTIIETSTIVDAIKDNAFREFLIETYGSNGGITQEEADRVTDLELNADNAAEVKSLAGIEYFRNLKTLKVSGLESLDDTNLAVGNINLTSVDISLVKGLTAIDCNGLQSLTTFSLVVTGAAGTEVGPKRVELDKCPKIESVTVKDCRAIVAVTVTGCTELTSLNLSGSYLEKWESEPNSGKWIYPSINIYTNTKLTDPANFIPAANLVDIWATSAQIEAFRKYFETNYKWTWHSNDETPSASVVR